jgi:glucose-1-phosphate thymidylyltransferase
VPPIYIFTAATLTGDLPRYLAGGGDADAPGSLIPWLIRRKPVHAFQFNGERYDIGTPESYRAVRRAFGDPDA